MAQGYIGYAGSAISFDTPQSINLTMGSNAYPNGSVTFDNITDGGAYWKNNNNARAESIDLYLCDSAGNNRVFLFTVSLGAGGTSTSINSATISGATGLAGKALYLIATGSSDVVQLRRQTNITMSTASLSHTITCSAGTGGTLTASASSAQAGATITLTPTPSTGYQLSSLTTSPSVTITNNKFTMPNSNITVTATFTKKSYTITKKTSPSGGGTVTTSANTAKMGDSVTISQTPATGYYFTGWTTSPSVTISSGAFTMPAANLTVTANYKKRSTASLSKKSMSGGDTVTLTITTESSSYTHKYKLSFGVNMETSLTSVAAGVTSVSISVPAAWSNYIPNAASKSGGTLLLETYSGSTKIGEYTITGLTYNVAASAKPSIGTITKSIARNISGTTYADVGNYYVQQHCGVRIQTTASGALSSTISSLSVALSGYSGNKYNKTVSSGSIDFTTGLLTVAGTCTITVTATDSRGRTATKTATITVTAYNAPAAALSVNRADVNGDDDDMGTYGKFTISNKTYSAIGSNSLTTTLTSQGSSETLSGNTGNILPGNRQTFSIQQEYTITLTLADAFETVTIQAKLRSAKFIIYVNNGGNKLGFMKAASKNIPAGKNSTIEFSGDSQIYIGDDTLEDYIRNIVNNM